VIVVTISGVDVGSALINETIVPVVVDEMCQALKYFQSKETGRSVDFKIVGRRVMEDMCAASALLNLEHYIVAGNRGVNIKQRE
jgi:hypothetical protein